MKKGQIEIVGLMMIVVIAGLVIALVVNFSIQPGGDDATASETFGESNMGKSFVQVISNTYVEECGMEYSELVKDCVKNGNNFEDGDVTCAGASSPNSCQYVNETTRQILEQTLDRWGVRYYYHIDQDREQLWNVTSLDCDKESEKESPGRQVLSLYPLQSQASINMEICRT